MRQADNSPKTRSQLQKLQRSYQHNYVRHLLALSRHYRSRLMHHLQQDCGFSTLRLSWEPVLSLPGQDGILVGLLAEELGISKQHCDQLLRSIENKGYVKRIAAMHDKRSRLVVLSETGTQVIKAGIKQATHYEKEILETIGKKQYSSTAAALQRLCIGLQLPQYRANRTEQSLLPALIRLASHTQKRLMELTIARGHPGLQLSYGQVLNHIGLQGAGIQELAEINEVTKQAIVRIATQLENLGYTYRIKNPIKPRSKLIVLTNKGLLLLEDSIKAMKTLKQEWLEHLDLTEFNAMEKNLASLYHKTTPRDFADNGSGVINIHQTENLQQKDDLSLAQLLLLLTSQLEKTEGEMTLRKANEDLCFSSNGLALLNKATIKNTDIESALKNSFGVQKVQQLARLLSK